MATTKDLDDNTRLEVDDEGNSGGMTLAPARARAALPSLSYRNLLRVPWNLFMASRLRGAHYELPHLLITWLTTLIKRPAPLTRLSGSSAANQCGAQHHALCYHLRRRLFGIHLGGR